MEAEEIILKNIRLYRKIKDIKSENMAREIGISQSEYSKLENGLKRKWTEHLPRIAGVLGVSFQELVNIDPAANYPIKHRVHEPIQPYISDIELYERLIYEMKEKEKLKDELLNSLKLTKESYKKKYEIIKAKTHFEESNPDDIENFSL